MSAVTSPVDLVVDRLEAKGLGVKRNGVGYAARCPAHEDSTPSLGLTAGADGRALVICRAGCATDDVLAALDLKPADLFGPSTGGRNGHQRPEIVATYLYVDENDRPLYRTARTSPKGFFQQRPDRNGGWINGLGDTRRVLYRLPDVVAAVAEGRDIVIVEGEKDADRLVELGITATTNAMGAGKWRPEYTEALRGANVVIVADLDAPGRAHATQVAAALDGVAATVRRVEPAEGKDLSDHLTAGRPVEDLVVVDAWTRDEQPDDTAPAAPRRQVIDGATFIRSDSTTTRPIWGTAEAALWTVGESLLIAAPTGVGKTTLAQQLLLSLIGVRPPELLGQPVTPIDGPVLYIAADRPAQAARSLNRMVTDDDLEQLRERLIVWRGPPPFDLRKEPEMLSIFGQEHGARLIIIDSLKDLVPDLSKEESGGAYNIARQHALAAGIDLAELHHQRKTGSGGGKPKHIEDVYGSTWITAGAGSVVVLWGEAGDPVIELLHLKQPAEQVGPLKVVHDHHVGVTRLADDHVDLLALLRTSTRGVSARSVACALFDTSAPKRNELEKARRRLDALVRKELATRQDGTRGGADGGEQALWFPTPPLSMEVR